MAGATQPRERRGEDAKRHSKGFAELDPAAGPDGGDEGRRIAKHWLDEIKRHDAAFERFHKRGMKIERRYRDERNRSEEEGQRRANYLWANTQIMGPAIYGKQPLAIAERRFKDRDPVGRMAAMILERALRSDMEFDDFNETMESCVLDFLLPGLAVAWVRYEPQIGRSVSIPVDTQNPLRDDQGVIDEPDEDEDFRKLEDTGERLIGESAPVDYINWRDVLFFPARLRRWKECRAVAKRLYLSYDDMADRWGTKIADAIPLQKPDNEATKSSEGTATAASKAGSEKREMRGHVFEIWDLDTRKLYWVAEGADFLVNRLDDPLQLSKFFPIPEPMIANKTNGTVVPVPFYIQYQDQAIQLDELTQRISQLAKACKVAGVYDASLDEIARLLDESVENELIPADQWRNLKDKGGLEGVISLLPIEVIVEVLNTLMEVKKQQVEEMDRITGMTDVLRGETNDARETLGRGRMNENNGKTRLRSLQDRVAKFCRDIIKIKAEIKCKHFSNRSLVDSSGILFEEGLNIADVMAYTEGDPSELEDTEAAMPPSPPQMGGNVVPFQRPGMPQPGLQQSAPPGARVGSLPGGPPTQTAPGASPGAGVGGVPPGGDSLPGGPAPAPSAPSSPPMMTPYGPLSDEQRVLTALQKVEAALELLRSDHKRGFRLDIDTDSHLAGNEQSEQENRSNFVVSVTKYLETAGQLTMAEPQITPLMGKLLQFFVRSFRPGRDLESSIEEFCDQAEKQARAIAGQPKPPSPEMIKAQSQVKAQEIKNQGEQQRIQLQASSDQREQQANERLEAMKMQLEQQKAEQEKQMMRLELQIEVMRAQIEERKMQGQLHMQAQSHQLDQQAMHAEHSMRMTEGAQAHQQALQAGATEHAQHMTQAKHAATEAEAGHKRTMQEMSAKPKPAA